MIDYRDLFDVATATAWLLLAVLGVARRVRRMVRLHRIVLPEPVDRLDEDYLQSVKKSTYLRLMVKIVFLIGALIALFGWPLWEVWRVGVVLALIFMNVETVSVDAVRERLGRTEAPT